MQEYSCMSVQECCCTAPRQAQCRVLPVVHVYILERTKNVRQHPPTCPLFTHVHVHTDTHALLHRPPVMIRTRHEIVSHRRTRVHMSVGSLLPLDTHSKQYGTPFLIIHSTIACGCTHVPSYTPTHILTSLFEASPHSLSDCA